MSNIIRDHQAYILAAFLKGLDQCADELDKCVAYDPTAYGHISETEAPTLMLGIHFSFKEAKMEISAMPELDLGPRHKLLAAVLEHG